MRPRQTLPLALLLCACAAALLFLALGPAGVSAQTAEQNAAQASPDEPQTPGALSILAPDGKPRGDCPLRHTSVRAEISGFLSRVSVTQEFENPLQERIEAVYTFPLPQAAAVDDMTMTVGGRTVKGKILKREEAQAVYQAARDAGQVAGLLDQERPNIFTQSVANISPGERVTVEISYVETLKYEEGTYEFSFPMVVGPRYVPGAPVGKTGSGFAPDTTSVPDGSRITPPVAAPGTRAGHDISVEVTLDAGVPLDGLASATHAVDVERVGATAARVRLKELATIPNKDFVLRYDVAGKKVSDALLTHHDARGGFFTFILQPPERVTAVDVNPKELVFVLDTSGSMEGFPIEKAKEAMKHALDGLYPQDTFNLITFAGDTHVLFPAPVPATPENLRRAQAFLKSRSGGGGTEMMKAIKAALDPSDSQKHVRIVCFMTDGYVGNDVAILGEIQKHPNARVFSFGIGGSVNRYLLDKMAEEGRGEVEYVGLNDNGSAAALRFHKRVRDPLLTDLRVEWQGVNVADVYPRRLPDLFSAKPVVITGRYLGGGRGKIRLTGRMAGNLFEREIPVELPEDESRHDVLATLWARTRIDDLMSKDYAGVQQGTAQAEVQDTITQLGLEFRLMTQFTSFVAVEEMTMTTGDGPPRRVDVPVELPEGVSRAGVFGDQDKPSEAHGYAVQAFAGRRVANTAALPNQPPVVTLHAVGGAAQETVTVTAAEPTIDMTSSSVSTKVHPLPQPTGGSGRKDKARAARRGRNAGGGDVNSGGGGAGSGAGTGVGAGAGGAPVASNSMVIDGKEEAPAPPPQPSPEEQRRAALALRLHPSLIAVIERLAKPGEQPSAEEAKFVREGRAEVQVWLEEKSDETLARLRELGFEVLLNPQSGKLVIGRLPVEKLSALAELKGVRFVAPFTPGGK